MIIQSVDSFLHYFDNIRGRTLRIITAIPADKVEWTYQEGKFTFGDLIRHLGTIERYMYAENVMLRPSRYPGCGKELSAGFSSALAQASIHFAEVPKIVHFSSRA